MSEHNGSGDGPQVTNMDEKGKLSLRIVLSESDLSNMTATEWADRWRTQDAYITGLEHKTTQQEGEIADLRQALEKARAQLSESQQREKVLVRRLAAKEQETQDFVCQVNELKSAQAPTSTSLRSALLDPAVNSLLHLLRNELQATRLRLEDTQNELSAWKFTPDSNTGKRLMAKCRLLYQENEELGKITSSGRVALLEGDLELQKKFSEEVRQSQLELDSFLADLDEDVEGMQSTILFLQQELRKTKDTVAMLQKENAGLKATMIQNGRANGDTTNSSCVVVKCERLDRTTDSESDGGERTRIKRVRRSSVLSIDYNEDDTLVINANGDVAMSSDPE
ncbi:pre-mRNA-splicing regulator female-lethal(2)D [Agrilus planipennis]|uniref:Pre-mRNA-splicing regulator female-lethal(2)D n=1 Tax=Agrilus planipennis TaxID=224129 RepID=A0A1W4WVQ5_AGRPL|nr:pre-mRNA-splicing regulator female-lethal(2)D [Agrilus planipennis]XP_018327966.1 pre-mRNA-splicing regulator female-lethal(2)D [Agrilus planipennis]